MTTDRTPAEGTPESRAPEAPEAAAAIRESMPACVTVRVERETLVLHNESGQRVACLVQDAAVMRIAQFPPSGAAVMTLEVGAVASVSFTDIDWHTGETRTATLQWWPLHATGEPLSADDYVRTSEIRLRW